MLTFVPACAEECAKMRGELLIGVDAESVFQRALMTMGAYIWHCIQSVFEGGDGFAVIAHVRGVPIGKYSQVCRVFRQERRPQLDFNILSMRSAQVPIQIDTIRNLWH